MVHGPDNERETGNDGNDDSGNVVRGRLLRRRGDAPSQNFGATSAQGGKMATANWRRTDRLRSTRRTSGA